jgi:nucleoside-diphosphate-sugar epimerase
MTLLLTGASSFLGAHLVRYLRMRRPDVPIVAVVHRTPLAAARARVVHHDLRAGAGALVAFAPRVVVHLACQVTGADPAAANLAMLRAVLDLCSRTGAQLIHASTTQVGWDRHNAYARGRIEEERRVAASGVPYVILRPCAPYGPRLEGHVPRHPESFHRLADWVGRWSIVPMIGRRDPLRQPVHVEDWNDVIARFVELPGLPRRCFDVGGPEPLSFRDIVAYIAGYLGREARVLPIPLPVARWGARVTDGLTPDLVSTFACDDTVDIGPISRQTNKPTFRRFEHGVADLWRSSGGL